MEITDKELEQIGNLALERHELREKVAKLEKSNANLAEGGKKLRFDLEQLRNENAGLRERLTRTLAQLRQAETRQ